MKKINKLVAIEMIVRLYNKNYKGKRVLSKKVAMKLVRNL